MPISKGVETAIGFLTSAGFVAGARLFSKYFSKFAGGDGSREAAVSAQFKAQSLEITNQFLKLELEQRCREADDLRRAIEGFRREVDSLRDEADRHRRAAEHALEERLDLRRHIGSLRQKLDECREGSD